MAEPLPLPASIRMQLEPSKKETSEALNASKMPTAKNLSEKHLEVCNNIVFNSMNGSKAYQAVYPDSSPEAAKVSVHHLLTNPNLQSHITALRAAYHRMSAMTREYISAKRAEMVESGTVEASTKAVLMRDEAKMCGYDEPDKVLVKVQIVWGE